MTATTPSTNRVAGARRPPPSLAAASNDGVLVLACAGRIVATTSQGSGAALLHRLRVPAPALPQRCRTAASPARRAGGRVFVAALDETAAPAPRGQRPRRAFERRAARRGDAGPGAPCASSTPRPASRAARYCRAAPGGPRRGRVRADDAQDAPVGLAAGPRIGSSSTRTPTCCWLTRTRRRRRHQLRRHRSTAGGRGRRPPSTRRTPGTCHGPSRPYTRRSLRRRLGDGILVAEEQVCDRAALVSAGVRGGSMVSKQVAPSLMVLTPGRRRGPRLSLRGVVRLPKQPRVPEESSRAGFPRDASRRASTDGDSVRFRSGAPR